MGRVLLFLTATAALITFLWLSQRSEPALKVSGFVEADEIRVGSRVGGRVKSVLLSGFMFPRSQMPTPIYLLTFAMPVTYFVDILRGVVLRGADFVDLLPHVIGLFICGVVILGLSLLRFRKQLA